MMKNIKLIFTAAALVFTWALPVFGQCLTLTTTNTPSACVGLANGSINLTVGGGSGSYSYNWAGPNGFTATTEDLTGLVDGTYTCTVVEPGCTESITTILSSLQIMTLESLVTNINCFGNSNGLINIVPGDGVSPYTFAWSNGAVSEDLSGLSPGNYSVIVTDNNGCKIGGSYAITQPTALNVSTTQTNVICFGQPQLQLHSQAF
jgi:hypothetical protein